MSVDRTTSRPLRFSCSLCIWGADALSAPQMHKVRIDAGEDDPDIHATGGSAPRRRASGLSPRRARRRVRSWRSPAANASAAPGNDPSDKAMAVLVRRCASRDDTLDPNIASGARPRRTNSASTRACAASTRPRNDSIPNSAALRSGSGQQSNPPSSTRPCTSHIRSTIPKGCDSERKARARPLAEQVSPNAILGGEGRSRSCRCGRRIRTSC